MRRQADGDPISPASGIAGIGKDTKMVKETYFLNIAPLLPGHEAELAADIASMAETGIITHNAFIFTLNPEGDPPVDKAAILGERYTRQVAELRKRSSVPCGILMQATIGHGWTPNAPSPGQKFVRGDGTSPYVFCPLDPGFREYISGQVHTLALLKPDFFMLDDDFRMLTGRGGCFCPLHIAGFNRITGKNYTAETLLDAIRQDESIARAYDAWLQQGMEEVARIIRDAIDSVTPNLPCSFCMCADDVRHAASTGKILQGNAPLRIRINNGYYLRESGRGLPIQRLRSATQALYLPEGTEILDEPDTCPQNRYSTSAAMLHNHLTRGLAAGYSGAKIWITRTGSFEPDSGRAYRKVLTKYSGFYRTLCSLGLKEDGILIPLPSEPPFNFPQESKKIYTTGNWLTLTSVMGFPFHVNKTTWRKSTAAALAGDDCDLLSDAEIEKLFELDLILDGSAALKLSRRGFSRKLGITADEWGSLPNPSFETGKDSGTSMTLSISNKPVKLSINPGIQGETLTWISHQTSRVSDDAKVIAPGSIRATRPDGHSLFVTAASLTPYRFEIFSSFLNETRKVQFAEIFQNLVSVYYQGDAEVMMQSGHDAEGNRIAVIHSLSPDELENPGLVFREEVKTIDRLMPDGSWNALGFSKKGRYIQLELCVRMLYPEVLRIR